MRTPTEENLDEFYDLVYQALNGNLNSLMKLHATLNNENSVPLYDKLNMLLAEMPEHSYIHLLLGILYLDGFGIEKDYQNAIRHFNQAIFLDPNCDYALTLLAYMFERGLGGQIDLQAAIELYDQAIKLGNPIAMNNRAFMHQHGLGGPKNEAAAIALYDRAIELNHAYAMTNRAAIYLASSGDKKRNYEAATALYTRAIALGNVFAMHHRGYLLFEGKRESENRSAANSLFDQAVRLIEAMATNNQVNLHCSVNRRTRVFDAYTPRTYTLWDCDAWRIQYHRGKYLPYEIAFLERHIGLGNAGAMTIRAAKHSARGGNIQTAIDLLDRAITLGNPEAVKQRASIACKINIRKDTGPKLCRKILHEAPYHHVDIIKICNDELNKYATKYKKEVIVQYPCIMALHQEHKLPGLGEQGILLLLNDDFFTPAEKIRYLQSLWPDPKKLLKSLQNPKSIAAFAAGLIKLAEQLLAQSDDRTELAQHAFILAEEARQKLQNLTGEENEILHNLVHERFVLAHCEPQITAAQTDSACFTSIIKELRSRPTSQRANFMLLEILQVVNLEPYFTYHEKRQLIVIVASHADPACQNFTVQRLAANAIADLVNSNFAPAGVNLIAFDYLISIANLVMHRHEDKPDNENFIKLEELLQQTKEYDAKIEAGLLENPLVREELKAPYQTYENALMQSLSAQQKPIPLRTVKQDLLQCLDDLADFYEMLPQRFAMPTLKKINIDNSNDELTNSFELIRTISPKEEFAEFSAQRFILNAIANVLKSHSAHSILFARDPTKKRNSLIASHLQALINACTPAKATAQECLLKTIDFLSKMNDNIKPLTPIIDNLIQELSVRFCPRQDDHITPSQLCYEIWQSIDTLKQVQQQEFAAPTV